MFESDYSEISLEGKKKLCVKILKFASESLWLDELIVDFKPESFFQSPHIDAIFVREYYIIYLNEDWLDRVGLVDFTATILHEVRHAYQCAQFEFPEVMIHKEPEEIIEQWRQDFDNYVPSTGNQHNDMIYMKQSIEIDAVAFEKLMIDKLFGIDMTVHEIIRDDVERVTVNYREDIFTLIN